MGVHTLIARVEPAAGDESAFAARVARAENLLKEAAATRAPLALASSLSAEDMALTDMIARLALPVSVFTLDTGRLHSETLGMIDAVRDRYGLEIEIFRPDAAAVADYVAHHGLNGFYESLEARKACCGIRKVAPLALALSGVGGWVTGQRREQSLTRSLLAEHEWDEARAVAKFNPLAEWSWEDVARYVSIYDVPENPLHARGYPSIGCEPCTRAIRPGEDPRAGRWWWEQSDKKECGLHVIADGAGI